MQEFPNEIKLNIMKFCDARGLISLGLVCKSYYKQYQPIQHIMQGLSHPDHFIQLTTLQQLINNIEQNNDLFNYYSILIEQLRHYEGFNKRSIRNLYAYILIAIMSIKLNDSVNLSYAITKLRKECIETADSDSLFHYIICRINKTLGISDTLQTMTEQILKQIDALHGPYNDSSGNIKKNSWLFKLLLIENDQLLKKRKHLLEQISKWFSNQKASTYANNDVCQDMYLNLRWLMHKMPLKEIQKWVDQKLLKSLLPLSQYNYHSEKILCLNPDEALDIFQLVGMDYFSQLLQDKKLTVSGKSAFLNLLATCQNDSVINKFIANNHDYFFPPNKTLPDMIEIQSQISKKIVTTVKLSTQEIALDSKIDILLDSFTAEPDTLKLQKIINLLKNMKTTLTEKTQERFYQLALASMNNLRTIFEPWELKNLLSEDQYHHIEQNYTETQLPRHDDYYSFRIILYAKQDSCRQVAISSIETYLSSQSSSLYELNNMVKQFENLLTPNMRQSILSQYRQILPSEIKKDVYHDYCRTAYTILQRWKELSNLEEMIKILVIKEFNRNIFDDTKSYQSDINYANSNNYLRLYLSLFSEDEDNLYNCFFLKLKPTILKFYTSSHNYNDMTKIEMHQLLLRSGSKITHEIIYQIWLPLFKSDGILQIRNMARFVQSCFKYIPKDLLTTEIIPELLLQKNHSEIAQVLLTMYDLLTFKQRQLLCQNDAFYQSLFIELARLYDSKGQQFKRITEFYDRK